MMPEKTPDPTGDGETTSASGPRRSGLDRLRAARGAATTESPIADKPTDAESTSGGERNGRSTALLETTERSDEDVETTSEDTEVAAAGTDTADSATPDTSDTDAGTGTATDTASTDTASTDTKPTDTASKPASDERRGKSKRATAVGDGAVATHAKPRRRLRLPGRSARPAAPTGPASRSQMIAALVLAVLVIGLLVPVVAMRHRIFGQTKQQKAVSDLVDKRNQSLAAARQFAVTFFSPDYKTIDAYSDQVAAQTTGDFNKDFVAKRAELKSLVTRVQSQATGRILAAGVSKVSGNDVEALVIADQDVKNTSTKGKTVTNRYRVRVSMQKTPKGWLVTNFEPVV